MPQTGPARQSCLPRTTYNRGSSFGRYLRRYKSVKKILGNYAGHELMIMKSFEHIGPMPSTMKVMVIAGDLGMNHTVPGKNDGKVAVEETKLSTPHEHRVIHTGHCWISHHPKVPKLAKEFFQKHSQ